MQLRDPLINTKTPPKATAVEAKVEDTSKTVTTAAHAINKSGVCPYCDRPMQHVTANGVPAETCLPCRICLPRED
jgi:hypothetical protein